MLTLYHDTGGTRKPLASSNNLQYLATIMRRKIELEGLPPQHLFILDHQQKPKYMMNKLDLEY